jgi:diguanylate cyclase (GGDEF)-like protein
MLIVSGLLALTLVAGATILTATQMLRRTADAAAMLRLQSNMNVAWHLLHDLGDTPRLQDGKLMIGATQLDGNTKLLEDLVRLVGGVATVFRGDERVATTARGSDGRLGLGTHLAAGPVHEAVFGRHTSFRGATDVLGTPFLTAYEPILGPSGEVIGILVVGIRRPDILTTISQARDLLLVVSAIGVLLAGAAFVGIGRHLAAVMRRREMQEEEISRRLDTALENMGRGLSMWDGDNRLLLCNSAFATAFNLPADRLRPGLHFRDCLAMSMESGSLVGSTLDKRYRRLQRFYARRKSATYTIRLAGQKLLTVTHRPMPDGGWLATYEDITQRRDAEARMQFMARYDALTRLANREAFQERLRAHISDGQVFAVLCIDLDHFKLANDTVGHVTGDALLRVVAARLLHCVRAADTVARLSGDEFAVILAPVADVETAGGLAARIMEALGEPYDVDGTRVALTASVGVALALQGDETAELLLKYADLALQTAKAEGRARWRFFTPGMNERLQERWALEAALRHAVEGEEFVLFYQPLLDMRSLSVCGFEALLRWRHPGRGMVQPGDFVPLLEESGLIVPVGTWVLQEACRAAARWPSPVRVAVNLSPLQFDSLDLVETVSRAISDAGLDPARLELEITEGVLLKDTEATVSTLQALKALGVRIAMDDFGTGYSSLAYIRRFPFDKIKIDKSFVQEMGEHKETHAIVRAVRSLAGNLGIATLAEGVETEAQLAMLRAEGCDEVQGYLFSRPRPEAEVPRMMAEIGLAAHALCEAAE